MISFVWKIKLADIAAQVIAPVGCSFCLLALITGAIWGKPTWGTWWVWDARLTSMLLLLFLYLGLIALRDAIDETMIAAKACGLLAIVGAINLPIIKYSVEWWNSLHQGATLKIVGDSTIAPEMFRPLIISITGFYILSAAIILYRMRSEVLSKEYKTSWVKSLICGR